MCAWRKVTRLLLLSLFCRHIRASSAPKAWWYGEFPAAEGMQGCLQSPQQTSLYIAVFILVDNSHDVAVKYGSSMVDGHGEYRIYKNFW